MGQVFYMDSEHRKLLIDLLHTYHKIYSSSDVDSYYLSAFYLITSSHELRSKCIKYVDSDGIDFTKIRKVDMGSGHKVLVKLASNIFNNNTKVTPWEMLNSLDDDNFRVAMQAIMFRRQRIYLKNL